MYLLATTVGLFVAIEVDKVTRGAWWARVGTGFIVALVFYLDWWWGHHDDDGPDDGEYQPSVQPAQN